MRFSMGSLCCLLTHRPSPPFAQMGACVPSVCSALVLCVLCVLCVRCASRIRKLRKHGGLESSSPPSGIDFTAVPSRPLKSPRVTRFSFACFSPAVVARFESRATVSFASSVCAWVTVRKACVHIASSWICLDGRATPELSEDQSDA